MKFPYREKLSNSVEWRKNYVICVNSYIYVFIIYENMKQTNADLQNVTVQWEVQICSRGGILLLTFSELYALVLEIPE